MRKMSDDGSESDEEEEEEEDEDDEDSFNSNQFEFGVDKNEASKEAKKRKDKIMKTLAKIRAKCLGSGTRVSGINFVQWLWTKDSK